MPSDSPVIITDGSIEIYTSRGDFNKPGRHGTQYSITKTGPATAFKFFGQPAIKPPGDSVWTVTLLDGEAKPLATISQSRKHANTIEISASEPLTFVADDMALLHGAHPIAATQVSITVKGETTNYRAVSELRIRFRDDDDRIRRPIDAI